MPDVLEKDCGCPAAKVATAESYDFAAVSSSHAFVTASETNRVLKTPAPNQLFVDLDDKVSVDWFHRNIGKIEEQFGSGVHWDLAPSPSDELDHYHGVVVLPRDISNVERILLRCLLGSDLKREALSWVRLTNNDPYPTLFYEKKPLELTA